MPVVWIPPLLRDLSGGAEKVSVEGRTVWQVIESLDARFPGLRERLCEENRLRKNLAVVVDGITSRQGLRQPVGEESEVHFLTVIRGGGSL